MRNFYESQMDVDLTTVARASVDSETKEQMVASLSDKCRADFLNGLRRDTKSLLCWGEELPHFPAIEEDYEAYFGDARSRKAEKTGRATRPSRAQLSDFIVTERRALAVKARRKEPSSSAKGTSSDDQDYHQEAGNLPPTPLHSTPVRDTLKPPSADPKLLQGLAEVYAILIKSHKVPSVMEELYFVIQMLTAESPNPGMHRHPAEDMLGAGLGTSSNAVFFAVEVLKKISYLFKFLDPATLRMLKENTRVQQLGASPLFHTMQLEGQSELDRSKGSSGQKPNPTLFDESKDSGAHFSSDMACKKLKAQRDELAAMLIIWSQNQWQNKWSMPEALGERITELFRPPQDPYVLHRFSQLFVDTLTWETVDRNIPDTVRSLNPSKSQRLLMRQAAYRSKGPSPPPGFSNQEKFFRNFIKIADSYQFCFHLTNVLVSEIDKETEKIYSKGKTVKVDNDTMCRTVEKLQVLGKFLGLVTFLPYQTVAPISPFAQDAILKARMNTQLPVDLKARLLEAVSKGHLVLTLPWIIEMLSVADSLAFRLPSLQDTLATLRRVQREALTKLQTETCNRVDLMVLFKIEWLLRIPSIPTELAFQTPPAIDVNFSSPPNSLDTTAVFDTVGLYGTCPFLHELTVLLKAFTTGTRAAFSFPRNILQSGLALPSAPLSGKTKDEAMVHDLEECLKDSAISDDRRAMRSLVSLLTQKYVHELSVFVQPMFISAKQEFVRQGKDLEEENCSMKDTETSLQKIAYLIARTQAQMFTPKVCSRFHELWRPQVKEAMNAVIRSENRMFLRSIVNVVCLDIERELRQWLQQFQVNLKNRLMSEINAIITKISRKKSKEAQAEDETEEREEKPFKIPFSPRDPTRPESLVSDMTAVEESWTCTCHKLSEGELSDEEEMAKEHDCPLLDIMAKGNAPKTEADLSNPLNEVIFQALTTVERAREGQLTYEDRLVWVKAQRALAVRKFQEKKDLFRIKVAEQVCDLLRQLLILAIVHQPDMIRLHRPAIDAFHEATTIPSCKEFISCAAWNNFQDVNGDSAKLVAGMEEYCLLIHDLAKAEASSGSINFVIETTIEEYTRNKINPRDVRAYAVVGALIGLFRAKSTHCGDAYLNTLLGHLGVFFLHSPSPLRKAVMEEHRPCGLDSGTIRAMDTARNHMETKKRKVEEEEEEEGDMYLAYLADDRSYSDDDLFW